MHIPDSLEAAFCVAIPWIPALKLTVSGKNEQWEARITRMRWTGVCIFKSRHLVIQPSATRPFCRQWRDFPKLGWKGMVASEKHQIQKEKPTDLGKECEGRHGCTHFANHAKTTGVLWCFPQLNGYKKLEKNWNMDIKYWKIETKGAGSMRDFGHITASLSSSPWLQSSPQGMWLPLILWQHTWTCLGHTVTTALCALRAALGLYTQNELSGTIFNHSIQLPIWGAQFPQKLTTFPSQHPPQDRTRPQGQPVPGQQTSDSKKCRVLVCCHKQQKQVLTFEESWRESKFNSSQKFDTPVLVPGGTKFFFFF